MSDAFKLLIVDDSKIMREAIAGMFDSQNVTIREASDGLEALALVQNFNPDVVTLDINMPGLDGISTLKRIMIEHPVPTVMLSSLTQEGARITFDALRFGAVDFISKPSATEANLNEQIEDIQARVRYASEVELGVLKYIRYDVNKNNAKPAVSESLCQSIVAIGAAEGGYGALLKIIPQLACSQDTAFIVSIHAAPQHVEAFVQYLNAFSQIPVKLAQHNEIIKSGCCYISSGSNYMSVHREHDHYSLHISPAPFASRRGSIDMLFFSTAEAVGDRSTGVILSGLGEDGAEGIEEIVRVGGKSIAQHPKTCFCKEMVMAALDRTEIDHLADDVDIPSRLNEIMN